MRAVFPHADHVVANSNAVANDLIARFGVARQRVSVIYNPVDIERISRLSAQEPGDPWCDRDEAPIVLGVGSLTKLKDFKTLIRAFAILRAQRRARLAILGEGGEREGLERLVAQLRLQEDVYLPGFAKNPFAWMRRARLLVSSSVTEGCPNVVLQSLACGTPVVCTDCDGGSSEILDHGRWGRLVRVRDEAALANAMIESFDEPPRRDLHSRAAHFSIDEVAKSFLAVLLPAAFRSSGGAVR
jgi:glycosyltransferase involved in cell wall biosynthesis